MVFEVEFSQFAVDCLAHRIQRLPNSFVHILYVAFNRSCTKSMSEALCKIASTHPLHDDGTPFIWTAQILPTRRRHHDLNVWWTRKNLSLCFCDVCKAQTSRGDWTREISTHFAIRWFRLLLFISFFFLLLYNARNRRRTFIGVYIISVA